MSQLSLRPARKVAAFGAVAAALAVGACNEEFSVTEREVDQFWRQAPTDQVDILWVIDNSTSMREEQITLAQGFSAFAAELDNTGVDFHLGVINTEFSPTIAESGRLIGDPAVITSEDEDYVATFAERVQLDLGGSGREKGLAAARHALSSSLTTSVNAGFLRADANLLIVFISDENDCSDENGAFEGEPGSGTICQTQADKLEPIENFVASFEALKSRDDAVKLGAIVGPTDAVSVCGDTTQPGVRYLDAVALKGGLAASICETDWTSILTDLGLEATGITTTFEMCSRAKEGTLEVFIDGDPVPEGAINGYLYDDESATLSFHGDWIPGRGAEVEARWIAAGPDICG